MEIAKKKNSERQRERERGCISFSVQVETLLIFQVIDKHKMKDPQSSIAQSLSPLAAVVPFR